MLGLSLCLWVIHYLFQLEALAYAREGEAQKIFIRHLWYNFYAATFVLFACISKSSLNYYNLKADAISKIIISCHLLMAFIQVARYLDRMIIETNLLASLYNFTIPLINSGYVFIVVGYTIFSIIWMRKAPLRSAV